jgi:transcriptional regulator with XRE-family HTH domain
MNSQTLQTISKLRRVSQSELARIAGVSRQAVSRWFKVPLGAEIHVLTPHLRKVSEGLHVKVDDLLRPLPVLEDIEKTRQYEAALLWDRLYLDLADFSIALVRGELPSLARLVQVFGLYKASKIAGQRIWDRFPDYKKYIRPIRREQLERVWEHHQSPISV